MLLLAILLFLVFHPPLFQSYKCGQSLSETHFRIVGGAPVHPHQYPWMVFLDTEFKFVPNQNHFQVDKFNYLAFHGSCGGVVIDSQWILSAAHCFESGYSSFVLDKVVVSLGVHNISDDHEPSRLQMVSDKTHIFRHELYNDSEVESAYDIALVKLSQPINLEHPHYGAVCLPADHLQISKSDCLALGWGKTGETRRSSSVLQSVRLPLISGEQCAKLEHREKVSHELQLCAGFGGHGVCKGDSGGGILCLADSGSWVVTGITSYSDSCGSSSPAVFTNVHAFLPWIDKIRLRNN